MQGLQAADVAGCERGGLELTDRWHDALTTLEESQSVEYKEAIEWERLEPIVAKGVLALSNSLNPGLLIVGVSEKDKGQFEACGIPDALMKSYSELDLKQKIGSYSTPQPIIRPSLEQFEGKTFLVIRVQPFRDFPLICIKTKNPPDQRAHSSQERASNRSKGTRQGMIYYRGSDTQSRPAEGSDWLDLMRESSQRALGQHLEQLGNVGCGLARVGPHNKRDDEAEKYSDELGNFWNG